MLNSENVCVVREGKISYRRALGAIALGFAATRDVFFPPQIKAIKQQTKQARQP